MRVLVTGASGWLGMATLHLLRDLLGPGWLDRVFCFGSSERTLFLVDGTAIVQQPLVTMSDLKDRPSLLLHYAYLTREKSLSGDLAGYIAANRAISEAVRDVASGIGVRAVFLPSSGAVYNPDRSLASDISANPYGVLKLEDELMFRRWATRCSIGLSIARVFNLSGPYINKLESYALATLILNALRGTPMTIRAGMPVTRSYVSVDALLSVALGTLLLPASDPGAWDTADVEEVEMQMLAERIRAALNTNVVITRPPLQYDRQDRYVGDNREYQAGLSRYQVSAANLDHQILQTAAYLLAANQAAPPSDR